MAESIYHLALLDNWQEAQASPEREYTTSTLGTTLAEQGFIHCSFDNQVDRIANFIFKGVPDVVLLTICQSKLKSPVKVENLEGGTELFPHIYGTLNLDAVTKVEPYPVKNSR